MTADNKKEFNSPFGPRKVCNVGLAILRHFGFSDRPSPLRNVTRIEETPPAKAKSPSARKANSGKDRNEPIEEIEGIPPMDLQDAASANPLYRTLALQAAILPQLPTNFETTSQGFPQRGHESAKKGLLETPEDKENILTENRPLFGWMHQDLHPKTPFSVQQMHSRPENTSATHRISGWKSIEIPIKEFSTLQKEEAMVMKKEPISSAILAESLSPPLQKREEKTDIKEAAKNPILPSQIELDSLKTSEEKSLILKSPQGETKISVVNIPSSLEHPLSKTTPLAQKEAAIEQTTSVAIPLANGTQNLRSFSSPMPKEAPKTVDENRPKSLYREVLRDRLISSSLSAPLKRETVSQTSASQLPFKSESFPREFPFQRETASQRNELSSLSLKSQPSLVTPKEIRALEPSILKEPVANISQPSLQTLDRTESKLASIRADHHPIQEKAPLPKAPIKLAESAASPLPYAAKASVPSPNVPSSLPRPVAQLLPAAKLIAISNTVATPAIANILALPNIAPVPSNNPKPAPQIEKIELDNQPEVAPEELTTQKPEFQTALYGPMVIYENYVDTVGRI